MKSNWTEQSSIYSLRTSLVGSCDRRLLMFTSAPTNSSWARSLGAPQRQSTWWQVQPLSNACPDDRSPAITCMLPVLVLRVSTVSPCTPVQHTSRIMSTTVTLHNSQKLHNKLESLILLFQLAIFCADNIVVGAKLRPVMKSFSLENKTENFCQIQPYIYKRCV